MSRHGAGLVTYAPDAQHRAEEDHRDREPPFNRHVANERDEARWQTCARYRRRGVSIIQLHIGIRNVIFGINVVFDNVSIVFDNVSIGITSASASRTLASSICRSFVELRVASVKLQRSASRTWWRRAGEQA